MKICFAMPAHYKGGTLRLSISLIKVLSAQGHSISFSFLAGTELQNQKYKIDILESFSENRLDIPISSFSIDRLTEREAQVLISSSEHMRKVYKSIEFFKKRHWQAGEIRLYGTIAGECFDQCDLVFFASHGLDSAYPVLVQKPYCVVVTDLLLRYVPEILPDGFWTHRDGCEYITATISQIRDANHVFCTTPQTAFDVKSFAGYAKEPVILPLCTEQIGINHNPKQRSQLEWLGPSSNKYIHWITNTTQHKNQLRTFKAIRHYYKDLGGSADIVVTGWGTKHWDPWAKCDPGEQEIHDNWYISLCRNSVRSLLHEYKDKLFFLGTLPDKDYIDIMANATLGFHNVIADNGTFSLIECAMMGTPGASSDYPQMRYINDLYNLGLLFFDPFDIESIAHALKLGEDRDKIEQLVIPDTLSWATSNLSDIVAGAISNGLEYRCLNREPRAQDGRFAALRVKLLDTLWYDYPFSRDRTIGISVSRTSRLALLLVLRSISKLIKRDRIPFKYIMLVDTEIDPFCDYYIKVSGLEHEVVILADMSLDLSQTCFFTLSVEDDHCHYRLPVFNRVESFSLNAFDSQDKICKVVSKSLNS